jgi:hypothetical protein
MDISLLSGCYFLGTIPMNGLNKNNIFESCLELFNYYGSGHDAIMSTVFQGGADYLDEFLKSKTLIKNHLILNSKCEIEILNPKNCPKDFDSVIGPKYSNEIYFLLSQGIISSFFFNILMTNNYYESIPLLDSLQLRKKTTPFLFPFIQRSFDILFHLLKLKQEITFIHWFDFNQRIKFEK